MDRIQAGYYGYQFVPEVLALRLAPLRGCIPAQSRLIDLGCNDGTISLALLESGNAASSLGIDFKDIRRAENPAFSFIAADMRQFDLATLPEVDAILCLNVVHHLWKNGIDFARDFMRQLSLKAGTVICEMGSLTARLDPATFNTSWLEAMRAQWRTDHECWADLFRPYVWRRPLMTYPFQNGRRTMWKLTTAREPEYEFEVVSAALSSDGSTRQLRRKGTAELFRSKLRSTPEDPPAHAARHALMAFLKDCPHDCLLPMAGHPEHGEVYAWDEEVAAGPVLTPQDAAQALPAAEYREVLAFAGQSIGTLGDYPLDMLFDFRVARTGRGLTFLDFRPNGYAAKMLGGVYSQAGTL